MRASVMVGAMLVAAGTVWGGRPLTIDDADPVEVGKAETEIGVACQGVPECRHWDYPVGVAVGVAPSLEAGLGFGGQFEQRRDILGEPGASEDHHEHGVGDLTAGAKWRFLDACPAGARHALAATIKLPTADEDRGLGSGETDYDLTWIASRAVGEKAGIHLNGGYSWIGGPDADVMHVGVALDYQIVGPCQWVGEVYWERAAGTEAEPAVMGNTGIRWSVAEAVTLDIAGGAKLYGAEAPDFIGTVGLTWLMGR